MKRIFILSISLLMAVICMAQSTKLPSETVPIIQRSWKCHTCAKSYSLVCFDVPAIKNVLIVKTFGLQASIQRANQYTAKSHIKESTCHESRDGQHTWVLQPDVVVGHVQVTMTDSLNYDVVQLNN